MTPARRETEVVYKRSPTSGDVTPPSEGLQPRAFGIAPTVTPIVIGFLLLLGLISGLGLFSARNMEQVAGTAQSLVSQNSAHKSVVLNLRLALTKLDHEARAENSAESRREIKPPFEMRLNTAREEMTNELT